jgi:hypothetical protein
MLYEPPKTKQHIIFFGAVAAVMAVLAIVGISLFNKKNPPQAPENNLSSIKDKLQQEKIQKEFDKLEAMRKSMSIKQPTQEEIKNGFAELEKQRKDSSAIPPTQEQIKEGFKKLEQMRKL